MRFTEASHRTDPCTASNHYYNTRAKPYACQCETILILKTGHQTMDPSCSLAKRHIHSL